MTFTMEDNLDNNYLHNIITIYIIYIVKVEVKGFSIMSKSLLSNVKCQDTEPDDNEEMLQFQLQTAHFRIVHRQSANQS